jgi:hypothetical protein
LDSVDCIVLSIDLLDHFIGDKKRPPNNRSNLYIYRWRKGEREEGKRRMIKEPGQEEIQYIYIYRKQRKWPRIK